MAVRARIRTSQTGGTEGACGGFTLLEILVVLALIGVIAATFAPLALRSLAGGGELAALEIASALRDARSQAIAGNLEVAVTVDVAGNRYAVGDRPAVALKDDVSLALFTAQAELLSDHVGRIRYFPDGSATGGEVTVFDRETTWRVRVEWLTARVAVVADQAG